MTIRAVIFDLDATLIDTSAIQALRDARQWRACMSQANSTRLFPGIRETLVELRKRNLKLAVCTSAVSYYAHGLLTHHKIDEFDVVVAYHDAPRRKPAPDPIVAAMRGMAEEAEQVVGVGDHAFDAVALAAAGVPALGAGWSPMLDRSASWTQILQTPSDVLTVIARS